MKYLLPDDDYYFLYLLLFLLVIALIFVINQRRRALRLVNFNQKLQQANAKFQTLFEDTTDAILLIKAGQYLDVNSAALKLFGYTNKNAFVTAKAGTLAPPFQQDGTPSREKIICFLSQCIEQGSVRFEWQAKRLNAEIVWLEVIMTRITLMGETVVHLVARDIDEKKTMEVEIAQRTLELEQINLELIEQKQIFESLFFDSSDGVSLFRKGRFIDCNNALLAMLGYTSKAQFLSLKFADLSAERQPDGVNSLQEATQHLEHCLSKGSHRLEWLFLDKNQQSIWFELVITKIRSNNKHYIHFVWRNIADKKRLEQLNISKNEQLKFTNNELQSSLNRLKETQEQLVSTEKMASLGGLVAGVAHEINTPIGISLTGSSKFSEITSDIHEQLSNRQLTESSLNNYLIQAKSINDLIVLNLKRGAELVSSFKQIAVDQTSEEMRSFEVGKYIAEILASLASVTRKHAVLITLNCPGIINVMSFPGAFSQIFTNLIMNSITHGFKAQDSGLIIIDVTYEGDDIYILYKDNGLGISAENLLKIFDPFFTTNRESGGSGLGLSIIFNIVSNTFKGQIECESKEGEGTTFKITLCMQQLKM